jgi:hypothetical protein
MHARTIAVISYYNNRSLTNHYFAKFSLFARGTDEQLQDLTLSLPFFSVYGKCTYSKLYTIAYWLLNKCMLAIVKIGKVFRTDEQIKFVI